MFKARFTPTQRPAATGQQQQQPQPGGRETKAPPVEKERGPQAPAKLPGQDSPPERAR